MYKELRFYETYLTNKSSTEKYKFEISDSNTRFLNPLLTYLNTSRQDKPLINVTIDEVQIENSLMSEGFNDKTFILSTIALLTDNNDFQFAYELSFTIRLYEINTDIMRRKNFFETSSDGLITARMVGGNINTYGLIFKKIESDE